MQAKERAEQTQASSHGAPLTDEEQSLQHAPHSPHQFPIVCISSCP
jgi:hypothetical protein